MDKINILDALNNGDLIIRDLDELDKEAYQKIPIMDLSSYGNEMIVNKFSNNKDTGISDITSNLIQLNNIYNNQSEIIVDQEFVYIKK